MSQKNMEKQMSLGFEGETIVGALCFDDSPGGMSNQDLEKMEGETFRNRGGDIYIWDGQRHGYRLAEKAVTTDIALQAEMNRLDKIHPEWGGNENRLMANAKINLSNRSQNS